MPLPRPRDQVATKELPEFAHLRAHVYRAIKRSEGSWSPHERARRLRELHAAIVSGELGPGERLVEEELAERLGKQPRCRARGDPAARPRRARRARAQPRRPRPAVHGRERRSRSSRRVPRWNRWRPAMPRSGGRRARRASWRGWWTRWRRLHARESCWRPRSATRWMHRRILEISGHRVARDVCSRLNSQMVRFQFRAVLCPGRPERSLAEHRRSSPRSPRATAMAAETAMRTHLTSVGHTLRGRRAARSPVATASSVWATLDRWRRIAAPPPCAHRRRWRRRSRGARRATWRAVRVRARC